MDLNWFLDALEDEVEGATTYIKSAIELKAMSDSMSKTLYEMAVQESNHMKNIFDMSMDYYEKISNAWNGNIPSFLTETKEKIVECYTNKSIEIKWLISMYKD